MSVGDFVIPYMQGQTDNVMRLCASRLQDEPGNDFVMFLDGLCRWRRGDAVEGLRRIKSATALNPGYMHFDFMRERLRLEGRKNTFDFWESMFLQHCRFMEIDAFLISYPKCGRTWLRMMLGWYAGGLEAENPLEVYKLSSGATGFRRLDVSHDDYPHWKPADRLFTDKEAYRNKIVIFLVRDPRDVLVSNYFQFTRRGDMDIAKVSFSGSMSDFIRNPVGRIAGLVGFYNVWAASRQVPARFELLTYEELTSAPREVLMRSVEALNWPVRDDSDVDEIVEAASFGRLRALEARNAFSDNRLAPAAADDPESYKIRRGKVGGYVDYLSAADIDFIDGYLRDHLDPLYDMYR
jgi:hypothetical protein